MTGAVVIGGTYRGLGIVRDLGSRGIPVWLLTSSDMVAATSRYVHRRWQWPSTDEQRLRVLLQLAERQGLKGWTIFPSEDAAAELISLNHASLSHNYLLTTPPWDIMSQLHDKRSLHDLGARLNLDQPRTLYPSGRENLELADLKFPVILKPALKGTENPFTYAKAWKAANRTQLIALYDEACRLVAPGTVMVQEFIPGFGNDYAFAALCRDGQPLVSLDAWRPRQYPIEFGRASTYVETVDVPEVEEQARRLLDAVKITGLVHIGFKLDPRDGRYKLLDVNLRAWGSHTLGRKAGVDFSYLLWRLVHGEPVSEMRAPPGLGWMRVSADIAASARLMLLGQLSPREYLRSLSRPMEYAVISRHDALPMIMDLPLLFLRAFKRRAFRSSRS